MVASKICKYIHGEAKRGRNDSILFAAVPVAKSPSCAHSNLDPYFGGMFKLQRLKRHNLLFYLNL